MWRSNNSIVKDLDKVKRSIQTSFEVAKDEMADHLDSINRNTNEIQGVYDYLAEIDTKLAKLFERIDEIDMLINPCVEPLVCEAKLTSKEQEVFIALYTSESKVTVEGLARGLGFTENMVLDGLYNLQGKGVPIVKECIGETLLISLNSRFKDLQAKKNILKIKH